MYLDSGVDFSNEPSRQQFEPIGKDDLNCFLGVFIDQDYIVSNFEISSPEFYIGYSDIQKD